MAQVTNVRLVDDLDGGDAHESLDFALDNRYYEMDLSEKHAARLRESLAPFIAAARRAGGPATTSARRAPAARSSSAREDTAAVRKWAAKNGMEVSARGRIASSVREAYDNRGHAAVTPAAEAPPTEAPAVETVAAEAADVAAPAAETTAKPKRRSRKKTLDAAAAS